MMRNTNTFRLALATEHAINLLLACTDQDFQKYLSMSRWLDGCSHGFEKPQWFSSWFGNEEFNERKAQPKTPSSFLNRTLFCLGHSGKALQLGAYGETN